MDKAVPSFPFSVGVAVYFVTPKELRGGPHMRVCLVLSPLGSWDSPRSAPVNTAISSKRTKSTKEGEVLVWRTRPLGFPNVDKEIVSPSDIILMSSCVSELTRTNAVTLECDLFGDSIG